MTLIGIAAIGWVTSTELRAWCALFGFPGNAVIKYLWSKVS